MDFRKLISVANSNKQEASQEASIKVYSSNLPPPKKMSKSGVQSTSIQRFLQKKKAEEEAKAAEARRQREKLMAIRSQNTKNNKKAKIMASRTKDNDFSRIRLTEDQIESKKKVAAELQRKHLSDKMERMKARIVLEEQEAMLPRKRKRKSKADNPSADRESQRPESPPPRDRDNHSSASGQQKRPRPPPPSTMNFHELLKRAETKQFKPMDIPVKVVEEEKLMTKKERRLMEQERDRLQRKIEKEQEAKSAKKSCGRATTKNPIVVRVEGETSSVATKDRDHRTVDKRKGTSSNGIDRSSLSKQGESSHRSKPVPGSKAALSKSGETRERLVTAGKSAAASFKASESRINSKLEEKQREIAEQEKHLKELEDKIYMKKLEEKMSYLKQLEEKMKYMEGIEEKLNRMAQLEEKLGSKLNGDSAVSSQTRKPMPKSKIPEVRKGPVIMKKSDSTAKTKSNLSPQPKKKPFHLNPYLEPPRRILEPLRPQKQRKRIESDDDDEDDDDEEMNDFIDDQAEDHDEDYHQHIKEIFGYDRSKYIGMDDDDIQETSYADQMKEEARSLRMGIMEDIEEERKEREREKRRKMKLKGKK